MSPRDPQHRGWLRRLGGYIMRHRADLFLALGAAVLGSVCSTLTPLVARAIIDDVIIAHHRTLLPWLALLIGLAVAGFGFSFLRRYRGGRLGIAVQTDLRNDMHDHLQTLDAATLDTMSTGQLVSRANSDTALAQGLLAYIPMLSGNLLTLVLSLVVMIVLSPPLALIAVLIVPALLALSIRMRRRVFPASWDGQQKEAEVAQIVDEDVTGVRVVKAFGQEQRELQRLTDAAGRLYGSQMRSVRISARYQPMLQAVPVFGQVAVLALGGWMTLSGVITLGTFLAFSTYIGALLTPARMLAGILTIGQQARAGVERIFQLIDLKPQIADAPDAVDLPPRPGDIVFDDVSFAYGEHDVLHGFSLTVRAGERVALVGASGSGKSTAARMLTRMYDPTAGRLMIGGVDVRRLRLSSLRHAVGMAFEDAFLFSESVRDNIAYGMPDATDEAIEAAARQAHAHAFIEALPHGYDTVVGERGLSLSGGQRQRIALARALLRDPGILVLDDATSAIDARTEQGIHDELRSVFGDRTVLIVAQRHSTLRLADRIVVLDAGRIVAEGTHDELIDSSVVYRALFGRDDEARLDARRRGDVDALADPRDLPRSSSERSDLPRSLSERSETKRPRPDAHRLARPGVGAPSLGMGLGGGRAGMRNVLAPTPELLARVAALPPVVDHPVVDLAAEGRPQPEFSLGGILREFRRPLLLALVFVVIDAVAGLLGPAVVKAGIDQGVVTGTAGVLFAASGLYLVVTLAGMLVDMGESLVTGKAAQRIMLSLRVRIFAQLQRLSLDYYEREMSGRIMTRMTTDVDQFESLLQNGLLGALVAFVTFIGVGIALVVIDPPLGLAVLTVIVPLAVATVWFRRRASRLYDLSRERIAIVNSAFQESVAGIRESQAFTHEPHTIARFRAHSAAYLESRSGAQRLVAVYFPFVQFLSSVADAIVLGLGAALIAQGQLTAGALIAFLLYIDMFFSPIQQLSQVFDAWQQTRVSVRRVAELMKLESLTPAADDPVEPEDAGGAIVLEAVHFAYPIGSVSSDLRGPQDARGTAPEARRSPPEALSGVDVRISPGETIALVGETGAGKSTVMKLVARFYDPDRGEVSADGVDLRRLDLGAFRRRLGYVPQESFLFPGTVASNIAYGRPDAGHDEVHAAAAAVGADAMIAALPDGYDTEIAVRGSSLSAGQRQLIALARAELVQPRVLLLDEATSNLDLASEARVTEAMDRLAQGRTTVLIAHRLQTAMRADRIVMLDAGRVAEHGTHAELLARDGRYAAMWRAFELAAI
ncbi:MAG TPA: ABC transporter ATP-binding protein [Microbacterium sp.]|uniref:ABC transporter ATP-binding protein n=1 Tax=Microbacterium sp. TaxID=51671 RepID=UPI002B474214|nr:ABC transporter ATP-binding protein [Microbacterium sp.]HKT57725.1 ABC transporter ATP-binding protein [Microbacterium sp.]